jgi:hypothetical protein
MSKKRTKEQLIEQEEKYIAYLKKKLESENYKKVISKEGYEREKRKYDNAKLLLKFLKS